MSLPFLQPSVNQPPVAAFDTAQYGASCDDLDGVIRVWLSSIRPSYRRPVRGRSSLHASGRADDESAGRGRHQAP